MFDPDMLWIWIVVGAVALVAVIALVSVISGRRAVERARERADAAWADVQGHVRHRGELAGELAKTLGEAAPQERAAVDGLTEANRSALTAERPSALSAAENDFQSALRTALHVAKGYPALAQQPRFLALESELLEQDGKIQAARRFYNGGVRELSTKARTFPGRLGGSVEPREFFDAADRAAVAEPPRIKF